MKTDHRDTLMRFYKEVLDNGNIAAVDELTTEDFIEHSYPPGTEFPPGRKGVKEFLAALSDAFSGVSVDVHDVVSEGDRAAARVTFHGSHTGEFMGLEPTGKRIEWESIDWVRFDGDRAAEHWSVDDNLGLFQQLGLIPEL